MNLSIQDFLNLIFALVLSLGGTTVVILGLSKWFGGFLSKRLLDTYNNKHQNELEDLKSKYVKELEETKSALEKAKSLFLRYSEKQFELYNEIWKILVYTKKQADSLWEKAEASKIESFIEQIDLTKSAIDDNMLLIEEIHYNKLSQLISQFENFKIGKEKLIDIRKSTIETNGINLITDAQIVSTIESNRSWKTSYDKLLMEIGTSFREQIKG